MDESNKSDEAAGDENATLDAKPSPIDKLVSVAPDHEFTGPEISETIANLINVVRQRQPEKRQTFREQLIFHPNFAASSAGYALGG